MGNIEQIDHLETYINELGEEIEKVKKASEYLELIEQFQSKIETIPVALTQSKDQLKLYQEIMESRLELFQTTSKNIEAKQQSVEQSIVKVGTSLTELKQQQIKDVKVLASALIEITKLININKDAIILEQKQIQTEQNTEIMAISKTNKMYFTINVAISLSALGILAYLLVK